LCVRVIVCIVIYFVDRLFYASQAFFYASDFISSSHPSDGVTSVASKVAADNGMYQVCCYIYKSKSDYIPRHTVYPCVVHVVTSTVVILAPPHTALRRFYLRKLDTHTSSH